MTAVAAETSLRPVRAATMDTDSTSITGLADLVTAARQRAGVA